MRDSRPVNLDLFAFKFPLPAITSILHRISGVALFLGTAILLYLLQLSLGSEAGFNQTLDFLDTLPGKILIWLILAALAYHVAAGAKHLLMDIGIGETRQGAQTGATITLIAFVIAALLAGVWIW